MRSGVRAVFAEWARFILGLVVYAFGVHMTIVANIGVAPWDCLTLGLTRHIPFGYGIIATSISLILLAIDIAMKEKLGFGSIFDAVLTGFFIDGFLRFSPIPEISGYAAGTACMLIGIVIFSAGCLICLSCGQSCGPRDAFVLAVAKRLPRLPYGMVLNLIFLALLIIGFLLGGPVGLGTVLAVFGTGIATQFLCRLIRFEPRNVVQKDVAETYRILAGKQEYGGRKTV